MPVIRASMLFTKLYTLRIALRYLVAPKSHSAVNVISWIAMGGVAVATAAIVVVMSVFNGFSAIAQQGMSRIDPDLTVMRQDEGAFASADSLAAVLSHVPGVAGTAAVLEGRGLLISSRAQMPVLFRGVPDHYSTIVHMDSVVRDGSFTTLDTYGYAPAAIAVGVAAHTGLMPVHDSRARLMVPRRTGRVNPANPATAFRADTVLVTAITQVDQPDPDADNIYIPLWLARRLMSYDSLEATAVEIHLDPETSPKDVARQVQQLLPAGMQVLTVPPRTAETYRMIAVEKWMTFMMLVFILIVASFNIFSTLSLLVVEKRRGMGTLRALGATRADVGAVFAWQGATVTLCGAAAGIILGSGLALAQQYGGFIKLAADPSTLTIDVYPVRLIAADLLPLGGAIAFVALIAALTASALARRVLRKSQTQ